MDILQQEQQYNTSTKTMKKSKFTMLNPFNWIANNTNNKNRKETSQDTTGGQYHGNEESVDMDITEDNDDPAAVSVNDMKLNFNNKQPPQQKMRTLDDFYLLQKVLKTFDGFPNSFYLVRT